MMMKRAMTVVLSLLIGVSVAFPVCSVSAAKNTATKSLTGSDEGLSVSTRSSCYSYRERNGFSDAAIVTDSPIDLPINGMVASSKTENKDFTDDESLTKPALIINQGGYVEWQVDVQKEGFYSIGIEYAAVKNKPIDLELAVYIDGKIPYTEATTVTFSRIWKDDPEDLEKNEDGTYSAKIDQSGNQAAPDTVEVVRWESTLLHDNDYMTDDDHYFYLSKGTHKIRFNQNRESIAIAKITLGAKRGDISGLNYEEYKSQNGFSDANIVTDLTYIPAESSKEYSEQEFTMAADYSSASTVPSDPSKVRLNTIGGESWKAPGQWISWSFNVEKDGFYPLTFKYRQDYVSGFKVYRNIYIDGVIPYAELKNVGFSPNSDWENYTVSDKDGNPYYVYLTKGTHTLKLVISLGNVATSLQVLNNSVNDLMALYRQIIKITGVNPDSNRDYDIHIAIPDLVDNFKAIRDDLAQVQIDIEKYNEVSGGLSSFLTVILQQLNGFIERPVDIPTGLNSYKSNISSLSDMITQMKSQAMILDSIFVGGTKSTLPSPKVGFFENFAFSFKAFFLSFIEDYNAFGNTYDDSDVVYKVDKPVEVWLGATTAAAAGSITTGRDQFNVIKAIVDDEFVTKYNIPVKISLVDLGALTKAILAGKGPDCVIMASNATPVQYAMRGALEDFDQFNDKNSDMYEYTFEEVKKWFNPSAFISLTYEDGKIYGLPETQTFKMMFVRNDIMQEYGLGIPDTWKDLSDILTILQRNNMTVGIPLSDLNMFETLLLQEDGTLYVDDHSGMNITTPEAVKAFTDWTEFNTKYSLPLSYSALNRFRSGEMPILLEDYTFFNTLEVGAPEIKGLWSMYLVPGTVKEDGTVSHTQTSAGKVAIMIKGCDNKDAVWAFLSWFVSADVQAEFGTKIESRLGLGGRYATANLEAFNRISWSYDEQQILAQAWSEVSQIPKIPGDYYVTRMINNAFRAVVYKQWNPREALVRYSKQIDVEIQRKRAQYNIDDLYKNR